MSNGDHKELMTEVIKKQMVILGPDITLLKARSVSGLKVDDDGTVRSINGDPNEVLQGLVDAYVELSGLIVRKTMEPLLKKYPGLTLPEGVVGGVTEGKK